MNRAVRAALVFFCAVPFLGTAWKIFGQSPAAYVPLYPLALLFLFRSKENRATSHQTFLWFIPGFAMALCGVAFGRLSLVWIGSFWNILAAARVSGVLFAFPAPLLIFAAPPLAAFVSVAAGFSLRLWLTKLTASLLSFLDPAAAASGNIIHFKGNDFAVDRACEGMKMAVASLLIAAVLARFSNKKGRILIALSILPLWLAANFLRIPSLVLFRIPAGSPAHEMVGLVCFVSVILFPLVLTALAFPQAEDKSGYRSSAAPAPSGTIKRITTLTTAAVFAAAMLSVGFFQMEIPQSRRWPEEAGGFRLKTGAVGADPRIAIYGRGEDSLILKRDLFAPGTAHDPRICFEAAGFSFGAESEETIGPWIVRSARVEKAGKPARLFWWYSWAERRSPSDIDWRAARLKGMDVVQWNLYGEDNADLRATALSLLNEQPPR